MISSFRGFIPINAPCLFISPIDSSVISLCQGRRNWVSIWCTIFSWRMWWNHHMSRHVDKGRMIAAGQSGYRSDVIVWRYSNKSILFRFSKHDGGILCLAFSQDERLLATYGNEGRLIIWDMATGNIVTHHKNKPIETIKWTATFNILKTGLHRHFNLLCMD